MRYEDRLFAQSPTLDKAIAFLEAMAGGQKIPVDEIEVLLDELKSLQIEQAALENAIDGNVVAGGAAFLDTSLP